MAGNCQNRGQTAINVRQRLFICRCGVPGRIHCFYDMDGEKTDDPDEAVTAVIQLENGEWNHAVLADFETLRIN